MLWASNLYDGLKQKLANLPTANLLLKLQSALVTAVRSGSVVLTEYQIIYQWYIIPDVQWNNGRNVQLDKIQ